MRDSMRVCRVVQVGQQGRPPIPIGGTRHEHGRRRVIDVAVEGALGRVVEERRQLVELALGERVELVVVAYSAVGRQAEPDLRHGLGAVAGVVDQVLLGNCAALVGGHVAAIEARSDLLVELRPGSKSPASCSIVNWSKGMLRLNALITQSR